ncbi:Receptor-like protein kinase HSL1 [Apostasia shenzhenica]|uniref:non-specific serine/threonine protein kinase n=1 Tax=Apostasia shenzhenica TaxID=1088818 RepID=A0A2I0B0B6_9ASPA|nr:Receptor-like protein kinase HSL1 [Apostasia shenzhenica]
MDLRSRSSLPPPLAAMLRLLFSFFLLRSSLSLSQDGLYILMAGRRLADPNFALSDWNPRDPTPCNWTGISCSGDSVDAVDLSGLKLAGAFPSILCCLPRLSGLSLSSNSIKGSLPSSSLLPCPSLTHLDLSQNLLVGPLPAVFPPSLSYLDLSGNNFSGTIPPSLPSAAPRLRVLSLVANLLTGTLPHSLGNFPLLLQLNLSYNPFAAGTIPASIGNLSSLQILWLAGCNLVGPIPPSLGHLANLTDLDLSSNSLSGEIPSTLSSLSSVVQIELYSNALTGHIPIGFSNLSALRLFDISMNSLSGNIPADIFLAPTLESLHLYENNLSGPMPVTLEMAERLTDLSLFSNRLSGDLPPEFGRKSKLSFVDLSDNLLSGEIPAGICSGGELVELLLLNNLFSGRIPETLVDCQTLTRVRLPNNHLSGEVPAGFWGLPHVSLLELSGNSLSGWISPAIAGATNLSKLLISQNRFTGHIPAEIGALPNLFDISASSNHLAGPLPPSLTDLTELGQLDLSSNSISGELPLGIENWKKLVQLNLANNQLTGEIPPQLGDLPVLNYLDLSGNSLTGNVPIQLQNLKLNQFNLSNNQLSGHLHPLFLTSSYHNSFLNNPNLCTDISGICSHSSNPSSNHQLPSWLIQSIFVSSSFILILGLAFFYWSCRIHGKKRKMTDRSKWTLTSFHKLGFSEFEILDCIDEDNVVGSGASGKVYKAVLSSGEVVAVKKLWGSDTMEAEREPADGFKAEVATLGKIRHKSIVKLWCCCSHKECKLLVYEYMPNGSLGDLLHGSKGGILDWPTRYRIALDAAEGLSYLHHDCVPPIVHRDVKSNNILLDGELRAKVADFGVAKVIGKGPSFMSVVAGSLGYIAPEYAYTLRVNEKSDIYSFGIVILELVTGKLPIDPELGEKDLAKWVCSAMDQDGEDHVIDPKLDRRFTDEMCRVLSIGLLCASSLPINRPSMRRVVKMLVEASSSCVEKAGKKKGEGKLSPYYYEDGSDHSIA